MNVGLHEMIPQTRSFMSTDKRRLFIAIGGDFCNSSISIEKIKICINSFKVQKVEKRLNLKIKTRQQPRTVGLGYF